MKKGLSIITCLAVVLSMHAFVPSAAADEPQVGEAHVVVVKAGEDGQEPVVISQTGTGVANAHAVVSVVADDENDTGEKQMKVFVNNVSAGTLDPNRGWLGVYVGDVTGDLKADPNIDENAVAILKVVEHSPAAEAGLMKGDVMVSLNGEKIEGGIDEGVKRIGQFAPGTEVTLGVVRDGEQMAIPVTLDKVPSSGAATFTLKDLPEGTSITNRIRLGKVLRLDDDGQTHVLDLDSLEDLGADVALSVQAGKHTINLVRTDDEGTIEISQTDEGPITVKRWAVDEEDPMTSVYDTPDDLRAADPEAAELYDGIHTQIDEHAFFVGSGTGYHDLDIDFDFDFDSLNIEEHIKQAHEAFAKALASQDRLNEAQEVIDEAVQRFHDRTADLNLPDLENLDLDRLVKLHIQPPTRSIRVNPDGQIEVTHRRGDTELVKVYSNEADLQTRDPETYEKYLDMQEISEGAQD